ncbi:MAG: UDP-N-acetylmuramoyl-tripeptide--D-alanyl-D-alanine ligase [Actinobacteria bacterium]|nr:MAG: UDP-N-acetylmuramoyl-tripeptide--D-alanyl-D-alanine ligase [Actinomycetota bacterium]
MIPLPLSEIPAGRLDAATGAQEITGVKIDSRLVEPGDLFVAIGRGVEFLEDARARGAAAMLVPDEPFAAMAALGAAVRERSGACIVGITGSMGKTGTKDILAALCEPQARTVAAEASFNNELGVPLTLCRLEPDTEVCILELAMRGFGQIADLAAIARPDIGVVTNVGPVHLELVGDLEGVERAKGELVDALPPGGTAIVPRDFPVRRSDLRVVRLDPPEDALVENGRTLLGGVTFGFTARHQAANAAAALAVLDALGLERPSRVEVSFSRWRGDEVPLPGGGLLINDCYNANPVSMRAALSVLADRAAGRRRVAILGDMAELGPDAPRYHREAGAAAAELGVQALVAVGPLARGYVEGAEGVEIVRWAATLEEGLEAVREIVEPGDCVLVKGSRAMGLEAVADALAGVAA